MAKKAFPLRIEADIFEAVRRWSEDEIRSVNAQIEYVLREALRKAGRMPVFAKESANPAKNPGQ